MRILLACHAYPPRSTAGVEIYTQSLARALAPAHDVRVLYPVADPERSDLSVERVALDDGLLAYELAQHERQRSFAETYASERAAAALAGVVDDFAPEVVHVQHFEGLGVRWLARCAGRGARTLMTVHDHVLSCANGGQRFHRTAGACPLTDAVRCAGCTAHMNRVGLLARRWSRRLRARRAGGAGSAVHEARGRTGVALGRSLLARLDRRGEARIRARWSAMRSFAGALDVVIAPSRSLHAELLEFGVPAGKLRYLPHGLDATPYRRRLPPSVARRFGFLGSLVPHKGVELLLEAFRGMPPDAELVVAGAAGADASYRDRLLARGLPDGVRLIGALAHDRVPGFLAQLDCLVVPSIWEENAPLVVLEAFAAGVPVIAARIGGLPELLVEGGGVTFTAGAAIELRDILRHAYAEPGVVTQWARSIPPVRTLRDHVGELTRLYRGESRGD